MKKSKQITPLDQEERDLKKALTSLEIESIQAPSKARQAALKRAAEEGLKYQPFVRSILHKYVTGRLVEKSAP